eukprot:Amastigsp_a508535_595.p2 type:complete len:179 gc:universal Amastigsp_a508535_595:1429-893(-)
MLTRSARLRPSRLRPRGRAKSLSLLSSFEARASAWSLQARASRPRRGSRTFGRRADFGLFKPSASCTSAARQRRCGLRSRLQHTWRSWRSSARGSLQELCRRTWTGCIAKAGSVRRLSPTCTATATASSVRDAVPRTCATTRRATSSRSMSTQRGASARAPSVPRARAVWLQSYAIRS